MVQRPLPSLTPDGMTIKPAPSFADFPLYGRRPELDRLPGAGQELADFLDRVELMLAIEDEFPGVEITDDDVEQIQIVGDLILYLNIKQVKQ
jgi:hypothetical protein